MKQYDLINRVLRGGSWNLGDPSWMRASYRGRHVSADRLDNLGFRCAL